MRSDSDVLLKELRLSFGEKAYVVPVLRMTAAAKWRQHYYERTRESKAGMPKTFDEKSPDVMKTISSSLISSIFQFSEELPELVFSYAPTLPREEILEMAYDQEFLIAFKKIWEVTFHPFLATLGMAIEQEAQASSSDKSVSLN